MNQPPRICHLTSVHIPFDTRIFHKECRSLADAGYDVHLVARHDRAETINGIAIHPVKTRAGRLSRMLFTTWDVFRTARRINADIYHFHDPELIPVGVLLKRTGKRVIEDVHEDYPDYIRSKDYIPPLFRKPLAWITGIIERVTAGMFDAVIVVVPVIYDRFASHNKQTIYVHNFPFISELTTPVRSYSESTVPTIAYIGNITRDRGIIEMIRAIELANETRPVHFVIGGSFAPPSLREEVVMLPGFRHVDYRGFLKRDEVTAVLSEARAGIVIPLPYSHNMQGYMNKLFEYMAAGLPVIASDFPRWRPIVDGNECGLMVDSRNTRAIADAILQILEKPEEAAAMGARGRAAVESKYSWETEQKALLGLYRTILS
jgi:glycosyltransferase involved in cell wall biosynthesis